MSQKPHSLNVIANEVKQSATLWLDCFDKKVSQ